MHPFTRHTDPETLEERLAAEVDSLVVKQTHPLVDFYPQMDQRNPLGPRTPGFISEFEEMLGDLAAKDAEYLIPRAMLALLLDEQDKAYALIHAAVGHLHWDLAERMIKRAGEQKARELH